MHHISCLGRKALHTRKSTANKVEYSSAVRPQASDVFRGPSTAHKKIVTLGVAQTAPHHRCCRAERPLRHLPTSTTLLQGWSSVWVTSKQADSARLHEVPVRRKLPLMLRSAAVQQRALQHSQMLGTSLHGHPYPK